MEAHVLNLDKPRKLRFGFKAHKLMREKWDGKKDLTDIGSMQLDEIPFFAWVGLVWEDESLTQEKVEELIEATIPDRYTVLKVSHIVMEAFCDHMGVPFKKKAKTEKKLKTPSRTTVKSRSK